MNCAIYRSGSRRDTYLYVEGEGDLSRVPDTLLRLLGKLEPIMTLALSPDRKLAQADVTQVMRSLSECGYYLQLPPKSI